MGSELGDTLDVNDLNNDVLNKINDSESPTKLKRGETSREGEGSSGISSESPSTNNP